MHKVFTPLAQEVSLEGAVIMDYLYMLALASDGEFTAPIKDLLEEFPYLSYRKIHRAMQSLMEHGYLEVKKRNDNGMFLYEVTDKAFEFFFTYIVKR